MGNRQNKYVQIQVTFAKREDAVRVVNEMLDERLVCMGQIGEVTSFYNLDGRRCESKEFVLSLKTRAEFYKDCEKFIKSKHPYKCPQIEDMMITDANKEYTDWIDCCTELKW